MKQTKEQFKQKMVDDLNFKNSTLSTVNSTTFKIEKEFDHVSEKVSAEIGDVKSQDFKPHIHLSKWDDEVEFEIFAEELETVSPVNDLGKIKWQGTEKEYHFYDTPPSAIGWERWFEPYILNKDGGLEFEIVLKNKPVSNVIELKIKTKNLDFFYQPFLTPEERLLMDVYGEIVRPPEVEGSYAVYHKDKKGDYSGIGGKNYRTGKAFHIYRPKVNDSNGKEEWVELFIDEQNEILRLTIPQNFIDSALYPIFIDPNFGYETSGASSITIVNSIKGSAFTGAAGTGTSISAYLNPSSSSFTFKFCLYVSLTNTKFLNGETTEQTSPATGLSLRTLNFSSAPTLTAVDYVICAWSNAVVYQTCVMQYDTGSAGQGRISNTTYTASWPATISADSTQKYSIYCTYSTGGATAPPARSRMMTGIGT